MSEQPTFFTDRDLGHRFPHALAEAGLRVERHDAHFGPTTPDEEWLSLAGRRGWYVVTRDRRIRYRSAELGALWSAGVGLFLLIGKATHRDLADNFIRTAPRIHEFVRSQPRPFIAKVYRPSPPAARAGRVELWADLRASP